MTTTKLRIGLTPSLLAASVFLLAACGGDGGTQPAECQLTGFDFPGDTRDQDCDGQADNVATCDGGLALDESDPAAAARALDLCATPSGDRNWGLVSARWSQADGSDPPTDPGQAEAFHLGHGVSDDFGTAIAPRWGERILVLSSGTARGPGDPGYSSPDGYDKGYVSGYPEGFPTTSPGCDDPLQPHDATGIELTVRVPPNADGFSFRYKFHTYDHPTLDCSGYVDQFVAMLSSGGATEVNVALDPQGHPVDVNSSVITECDGCSGGTDDLQGTGYEDHGASDWVTVTADVSPGSTITLRLAVYDSGDGLNDTTVLVDQFAWMPS